MTRNLSLEDASILKLVRENEITQQSELQHQLQSQGIDIPQATLSRRLRNLNIAKIAGFYKLIGPQPTNLPLVLSLKVSKFGYIVLLTQPGNANAIGSYIDQKYISYEKPHLDDYGLLGTIAGDDTLLLLVKDAQSIDNVVKLLKEEFPYL